MNPYILSTVFDLYQFIIIVRIFMSWMHPDPNHPIVHFIMSITDPILVPVRDVMMGIFPGLRNLGLDFSPIVVILLLNFIRSMIFGGYSY